MYIARKTNFFYKVVANIMQYKYQEVFCNFLPTLGTECLCGMVKPTAFGPCMHCKNYTFIIILRDATMLSLFFSQIHRSFPTWPALWAAELQAGRKEKPARLSPPLCSCLFGGVATAASHEGTVWTCVQGLGKLHMISKRPKWKPLTGIILLCDTVTHGWQGKRSCMNTDITTQTTYTIIAW